MILAPTRSSRVLCQAAAASLLALFAITASTASSGCTPSANESQRKLGDGGEVGDAESGGGQNKNKNKNKKNKKKKAPVPAFTVHEWGLIGTGVNRSSGVALAGGPQAVARPLGLDPGPALRPEPGPEPKLDNSMLEEGKPVIYLHLIEGSPVDVEITVAGKGAKFHEHWPDAVQTSGPERERLTWKVHATKENKCNITPIPTATDARCLDLADGFCELAMLPSYRTSDAACLKSDQQRSDLLFYRSGLPGASLSLQAVRGEDGVLRLARSESKTAPGSMLRVVRSDGKVSAYEIAPPASGASIALGSPTAPEGTLVADPAEWLRAQLDKTGLSGPETDAFLRAWEQELLGTQAPAAGRAPVGLAGSSDELIFVVPQAEVNELMQLRIKPKPQRVVRAFLGYIDLT